MNMITTKHSRKISVHAARPLEISLGELLKPIGNDEFLRLSRDNQDIQIEMNKEGDLIIMPGTGGLTGNKNAKIIARLVIWSERDGTGVAFDSDTIFELPNGARRIPDASWISNEKWHALTDAEKEKILPFAPDFAIERRSPTDSIEDLQAKMREYIDNGTSLGWLIDPPSKRVFVYRPETGEEILENPTEISGETVLPEFVLSLEEIWD
jgi:Uma2 family endonuclease